MRFVDRQYAGMAQGVGMAKILGRIYNAQLKVGNAHLYCSFTIIEARLPLDPVRSSVRSLSQLHVYRAATSTYSSDSIC